MGKRNLDWWARIVITTHRFMGWGNNVIMQRKMKWCLWTIDEQHGVFAFSMLWMWKVAERISWNVRCLVSVQESEYWNSLCCAFKGNIFFCQSQNKMHCWSSRIFLWKFSRFIFLNNFSPQQYDLCRIILFYKSLSREIQEPKISVIWQFLKRIIIKIIWVEYPDIKQII